MAIQNDSIEMSSRMRWDETFSPSVKCEGSVHPLCVLWKCVSQLFLQINYWVYYSFRFWVHRLPLSHSFGMMDDIIFWNIMAAIVAFEVLLCFPFVVAVSTPYVVQFWQNVARFVFIISYCLKFSLAELLIVDGFSQCLSRPKSFIYSRIAIIFSSLLGHTLIKLQTKSVWQWTNCIPLPLPGTRELQFFVADILFVLGFLSQTHRALTFASHDTNAAWSFA